MNYKILAPFGVSLLLLSGCQENKKPNSVISKRYVHKYGYAVSQEEWETHNYPGQVVTAMRDGVMVTTTYDHGILDGPCTYTYPHSQTVEIYMLYRNGELIKEVRYDQSGLPTREEMRLSPTRCTLTTWYSGGNPMSIEELANEEIVEGQYFNLTNEVESRVDRGSGIRIRRDKNGLLLSSDVIEKGFLTKRESFYSSGRPEYVAHYFMNQLQGEKKIFAESGAPLAIEEWRDGKLHGLSTYFNNGTKTCEISYLNGMKNGTERHFVDGEVISQEIPWENDKKHGPSIYYVEGQIRTEWYYDGTPVSQGRFEELAQLDEMVSHISDEVMR